VKRCVSFKTHLSSARRNEPSTATAVIAAKEPRSRRAVRAGLFARISTTASTSVDIEMPPLSSSAVFYVGRLAIIFCESLRRDNHTADVASPKDARTKIMAHRWPGHNVRALETPSERAVVLCYGDTSRPRRSSLETALDVARLPPAFPVSHDAEIVTSRHHDDARDRRRSTKKAGRISTSPSAPSVPASTKYCFAKK